MKLDNSNTTQEIFLKINGSRSQKFNLTLNWKLQIYKNWLTWGCSSTCSSVLLSTLTAAWCSERTADRTTRTQWKHHSTKIGNNTQIWRQISMQTNCNKCVQLAV